MLLQPRKCLRKLGLWAAFYFGLVLYACNTPDDFGTEFSSEDWLHLKNTDTFVLRCLIANKDSLKTFNNLSTLVNYRSLERPFPLGAIDDPLFGKISAGFATQLSFVPQKDTSFLTRPIDSVVLYLRYDTTFFYGKWFEPMSVSVHLLDEPLQSNLTYYSSHIPKIGQKLGARHDFIPNARDSIKIKLGNDTVYTVLPPSLAIPLDTGAFMSILRSFHDSVFQRVTDFKMRFNGIALVAEKANGFVSLLPENISTSLKIYYRKQTAATQFEFNLSESQVKVPFYNTDKRAYPVEKYLNGQITCDSLLFVEPFTGCDARFVINYNPDWEKKFINHAVLEFYAASLPNDNTAIYSVPGNLQAFDYSTQVRASVEDVVFNLLSNQSGIAQLEKNFGGIPIKMNTGGNEYWQYKMNITRYFIGKVRKKEPIDLIISSLYKLESPARIVIHGNRHPSLRPKLHVKFSE